MSVVSDAQIATVAYNAGWRGSELATAVAVAIAESSGRNDVRNSIGASGLWQILESAHPEFSAQWRDGSWRDPQTNANMAFSVYKAAGNSWRPWEAYTRGMHLAYMGRGKAASIGVNPSADTTPLDTQTLELATGNSIQNAGLTDGLDALGGFFSFITKPRNWFRIAMFVLGSGCLIFGLLRLMDRTATGSTIRNAIGTGVSLYSRGKVNL